MTNTKFGSGAFVFTRARGLQPRDPDDLPPLAARHSILSDFIPTYAGDRVAISRAISQASSGLQREGFLLRPITRTSGQVTYGIVKEDRDEAEQKLEHDFEGLVSWSAEPDPSAVHGDHPIARRVAEAYQELRGKVVADDWAGVITAYLCSSQPGCRAQDRGGGLTRRDGGGSDVSDLGEGASDRRHVSAQVARPGMPPPRTE